MAELFINLIGLAAGALIAASSVPQIVANLRNPGAAGYQSLSRNLMIVAGNVLWIAFGLAIGAWPVLLFCTINAVLNAALLAQSYRANSESRS